VIIGLFSWVRACGTYNAVQGQNSWRAVVHAGGCAAADRGPPTPVHIEAALMESGAL